MDRGKAPPWALLHRLLCACAAIEWAGWPAELGVAAFIGKRIAGGRAVERALVVEAFSSTQQDGISMPWSHATLNFWFIFFSLVAKFWFSFYHAA